MAANNLKQLEQELNKELKKAMLTAKKKMLADMKEETTDYYEGTDPKIYVRTYALSDTPRTTGLSVNNNEISFDAYLDLTHRYTSGDNPTMMQVLKLANYGQPWTTKSGNPARDTIGKKGFWERAEKKMEATLNSVIVTTFS